MLKKLDLDTLYLLAEKQRYHIDNMPNFKREVNPKEIIKESEKLSFHVYRFLAETDDDLALNSSVEMLNRITNYINNEQYEEAKICITILESLLQLDIKFLDTFFDIKEIVKHGPITFRNLSSLDLEKRYKPIKLLKRIDNVMIDKLIYNHLKNNKKPYKHNKETDYDELYEETRKLAIFIEENLPRENDYMSFEIIREFLNTIVKDIRDGNTDNAKVKITIISLLLNRKVKYKETLLTIKELVKNKPITVETLKKISTNGNKR